MSLNWTAKHCVKTPFTGGNICCFFVALSHCRLSHCRIVALSHCRIVALLKNCSKPSSDLKNKYCLMINNYQLKIWNMSCVLRMMKNNSMYKNLFDYFPIRLIFCQKNSQIQVTRVFSCPDSYWPSKRLSRCWAAGWPSRADWTVHQLISFGWISWSSPGAWPTWSAVRPRSE